MKVSLTKAQQAYKLLPFVSGEFLTAAKQEVEIYKDNLYRSMRLYWNLGYDPLDIVKGLMNV